MSWKERFNEVQKKATKQISRKEKKKNIKVDDDLYEKYENLSFFSEIGEGFKLFFLNYFKIIPIFLILAIVIGLLSTFIFTDLNWNIQQQISVFYAEFGPQEYWSNEAVQTATDLYNQSLIGSLVQVAFNFIPTILGGQLVAFFLIEHVKNNNASMKESITSIFTQKHRKTTIIVCCILAPLVSIGIAFLYIPGILFMMVLGFSIFLPPDKDFSTADVLNGGYNLGKDFRMKTLALMTIGVAFSQFLSTLLLDNFRLGISSDLFFLWSNPLSRDWGILIFIQILIICIQTLFQPLMFCNHRK